MASRHQDLITHFCGAHYTDVNNIDPHQVLIDICNELDRFARVNGTTLLRAVSDHQDHQTQYRCNRWT